MKVTVKEGKSKELKRMTAAEGAGGETPESRAAAAKARRGVLCAVL